MITVTSADGTTIACERTGSGPPVVLVGGALNSRKVGPNGKIAAELAASFTVYDYERRGRGGSGDAADYSVRREIEDLDAVIEAAGGRACLFGISSGAVLALEAAAALPDRVEKVAMYEPTCVVDGTRPPVPADGAERVARLVAAGQRGAAVRLFLVDYAQVPAAFVAMMRVFPAWGTLKGLAHTLRYDMSVMSGLQRGVPLPAGRWDTPAMPVLVMTGGKSPAWITNAGKAMRDVLPGSEYQVLPGQTHIVRAKAIAPVLARFFTAGRMARS